MPIAFKIVDFTLLVPLAVVGVFTTLGTNISGVVNNLATFIKN